MISFLAALQFLTISPAFVKRAFTPRELGRSTAFFPLIGLLIGVILYAFAQLLSPFLPPALLAILLLATWLILTRALHFDGFLDICDGLFGAFSPEKRLEIMRDSRVGAFAVAGGALLLLAKQSLLISLLSSPALIIAPLMGRWVISLAIPLFPYARKEGMGRAMKDHATLWHAIAATAFTVIIAWLLTDSFAWLLFLIAVVLLFLLTRFVLRRIPGLTGDVYGALCELTELAILIAFVAKDFS